MLPNRGNGTFTLHVEAEDADGHVTRLGSRTITCTNATAQQPFGAIDTPSQGQTVSGNAFVNFGWALTPLPKSIPPDGSTITVYIDGVAAGRPVYNQHRADIADLFPGLNNSGGAIGVFSIDTTRLSNGVHTISWGVTDSAGRTEGIGSRYFTVQNGASLEPSSRTYSEPPSRTVVRTPVRTVVAEPLSPEPVFAQRGYGDGPGHLLSPDASGHRAIAIRERDRLVLHLGRGASPEETLRVFVQVGHELHPAPIGSSLDAQSGMFSWQPGVAFIGRHDLLFVRTRGDGSLTRIPVSVTLEAR
jgi:hypothetical protein